MSKENIPTEHTTEEKARRQLIGWSKDREKGRFTRGSKPEPIPEQYVKAAEAWGKSLSNNTEDALRRGLIRNMTVCEVMVSSLTDSVAETGLTTSAGAMRVKVRELQNWMDRWNRTAAALRELRS